MRTRATIVCVLVALASVVATAGAAPTTNPRIAKGVTAGGVDVSGMTAMQAAQAIKAGAAKHVMRTLSLAVAGRHFRLTGQQAQVVLNATATAQAALDAKAPPANSSGGVAPATVVPLVVSHSEGAVKAFVAKAAAGIATAPRDATIHISLRHITVRRSRAGHALDQAATAKLVDAALADPDLPRALHTTIVAVRARVTALDVERANQTIITIDRANFTLRLFKHQKVVARYGIAVGRSGLETPTGIYHVQDKQVNPSWHVPNSAWAGDLAGKVIPPGPDDPIVARWMGLANGVGIHGTNEPWSIGSAASHGCIRMKVPDVIALFERVSVGTPVLVK